MPLNFKLDDPLALDVVDGIVEGLPLGSTAPWMPGGRNSTVRAAEPSAPALPTPNAQPTALPGPLLPANLSMARGAQDPTGQYPALAPIAFGRVGSMDQTAQQPQTRMGTLKHVLGKIGTIAAGIADPNLIPQIPGTRAFREREAGLQQEQGLKQSELEKNRAQAYKDIAEGKKALGGDEADVLQRYSAALADPNTSSEELERLRKGASAYEEVTQKPAKTAQGDEPLGTDATGMNQGNLARWQVFHPDAKELPTFALLTPQSTRNQADRIDKMLQQIGTDFGTEQQRKAADALRDQQFAATEAVRKETEADRRDRLAIEKVREAQEAPLREFALTKARADEYDKLSKDYVKGYNNFQAIQDAYADPNRVLGPADWGALMGHLQVFRAGNMRINDTEVKGIQRATDLFDRARGLGQNLTIGAVLGPELRDSILKITQDVLERTRQDRQKALKRAGFKDEEIGEEFKNPVAMRAGGNRQGGGVPAGATGIAPGSDGKRYYHDANGKPLGVAP